MDRLAKKRFDGKQRASRVRAVAKGSSLPRLSVHVGNKNISAQIIDPVLHKTVAQVSSLSSKETGNLTQRAAWVGKEIGSAGKKLKLKKIVFDRGSKKYHGRVKALADAARKEGLEF